MEILFTKLTMKIKITPFCPKEEQLKKEILIDNNYYYGRFNTCGIVTEIRSDDDWL